MNSTLTRRACVVIPPLDERGVLPAGIHPCVLADLDEWVERHPGRAQRLKLLKALRDYAEETARVPFVRALILDGSFVTGALMPNDVDVIVVLDSGHDFTAPTRPFEYNAITTRRVRRRYQDLIDVVAVIDGSEQMQAAVGFFEQIRGNETARKGLLRIET